MYLYAIIFQLRGMDYLPLNINVSAESFTKSYLEALNGILKLTDTELQVLSVFLNYSKDKAGGKESRMHVRNILSFSRSNVYNYLKRLEEKGCLVKNEDASYR